MRTDGGPAFPDVLGLVDGMTLRDYFAAKALQGMLSQPADAQNVMVYEEPKLAAATLAYEFADAMLKARAK